MASIAKHLSNKELFIRAKESWGSEEHIKNDFMQRLHQRYPEIIVKSFFDSFYYSIKLSTGQIVEFFSSEPSEMDGYIQIKNMNDERFLEVNLKYVIAISDGTSKYQSCMDMNP